MARTKGSKDGPDVVHGPTRGTRKGNGPGWGGAAKGESALPATRTFAPDNAGNPDAGGSGGGSRPTFKSLAKAERIDRLKEMQWALAHEAEQEAVRLAAMDKLLDREEGKAAQHTIMTGAAGGPLIVVTGVPRADDD